MRGVINTDIKVQGQANGGHFRGGTICGGGEDKSMGKVFGGAAAGIVQRM